MLDGDTQEDLDLFGSSAEALCLYNFCNRCSTEGGMRALRRRMEAPWSAPGRIRATQQSLVFIQANRPAFDALPSAYVALNVDRYARDSVPVIRDNNVLEFAISAFALWSGEDRFYTRIARGVLLTCRIIRSLRKLFADLEQSIPQGELAPLLEEVGRLLALPHIARVPEQEIDRWFWQTLRIDQDFRLHEQESIRRLLEIVHELDALVSMADVTDHQDFVMPTIADGGVRVRAEGLMHPFVDNAITNPVNLDQSKRVLLLTGPNMAGKTTYLRSVATALYLAHLGMGVPASKFEFVPIQRLLTSISLSDDLNDGVSYFRAEALRVKAVAQAVADGFSVIAIMDEPFKGTNVKDAFDASLAILERFAVKQDCLFLVSSHLIELSERLGDNPQMDYRYFEAQEQGSRLGFDYVLHSGVSSQRLGMRVLSEEGIFRLLDGTVGSE